MTLLTDPNVWKPRMAMSLSYFFCSSQTVYLLNAFIIFFSWRLYLPIFRDKLSPVLTKVVLIGYYNFSDIGTLRKYAKCSFNLIFEASIYHTRCKSSLTLLNISPAVGYCGRRNEEPWVAPSYGCSLSFPGENSPNFPRIALGQECYLIQFTLRTMTHDAVDTKFIMSSSSSMKTIQKTGR